MLTVTAMRKCSELCTEAWSQNLIHALSTGDYMKNVNLHLVKMRYNGLPVDLDK